MTQIEIFKQKFEKMVDNIPASVDNGAGYVIDEVYKILDSLNNTELPEGLKEAAYKKVREIFGNDMVDWGGHSQVDASEAAHLFIAGAEWQKAKMMEEAVEGYVNYYEDSGGILMAEAQVGCPYHNGDKVKIIVIPEEK